MSRYSVSQHRGFTLIEALVVIMIVGVLLGLAAPSFVSFTSSQRVKTASFDLYAAILFARSEAIKRRVNVTVAPVSNDWKNGWTVSTGAVNCAGGTALRTQDSLNGVIFTSVSNCVEYRLDGRLTSTAAVGVLIQPEHADSSIKNRCIRVDLTGLPKTTNISNTTCP